MNRVIALRESLALSPGHLRTCLGAKTHFTSARHRQDEEIFGDITHHIVYDFI